MATVTTVSLITGLVNFAAGVAGIVHSYDPADVPDEIPMEALPCAITLPVSLTWKTLAFQGLAPELRIRATQTIYYMAEGPVPLAEAFRANEGNGVSLANGILTLADNYILALKGTPFLAGLTSPVTHMPVTPNQMFGRGEWAGVMYHILEFQYELIGYQ